MKIIKNGITGVDEVGRGPIAGPVVAAAVTLPKNHNLQLRDSKKLTAKQRVYLAGIIRKRALDFKIVSIDAPQIDRINILKATLLVMRRAVLSLDKLGEQILIDGNQCPDLKELEEFNIFIKTVVKGDNLHSEIQAAAIIAKVYRDQLMCDFHDKFAEYGFDKHKGYPTLSHKNALARFGAIKNFHRFSFAPLKNNQALKIRNLS